MVHFVFRLQQQVANIRRSEEADEQVLHQKHLSEEKLYIREKVSCAYTPFLLFSLMCPDLTAYLRFVQRKEIQTLQEKKKHLSAEVQPLITL